MSARGIEASLCEKRYNPIGRYYFQKSSRKNTIDGDTGVERIKNVILTESPWKCTQLFSITRTTIHKRIYALLEKYTIPDIRYGEVMLAFFGHLYGKEYVSQEISSIRDLRQISKLNAKARVNLSESSSSRYPARDVLNKEKPEFFEYFKLSLLGELKQYTDTIGGDSIEFLRNLTIEDMSHFSVNISKETRLRNKFDKIYSIYTICSEFAPQVIIKCLLCLLKNRNMPTPPEPITTRNRDEFELFVRIIMQSLICESNDKPISYFQ